MAIQHYLSTQFSDVSDLLDRVEEQKTPVRIQSPQNTYYVLSAEQVMALLRMGNPEEQTAGTYTLHDFELSEEDLEAYEIRRKARRKQLASTSLQPSKARLLRRLTQWQESQTQAILSEAQRHEQEEFLQELETSMLQNLQRVAKQVS